MKKKNIKWKRRTGSLDKKDIEAHVTIFKHSCWLRLEHMHDNKYWAQARACYNNIEYTATLEEDNPLTIGKAKKWCIEQAEKLARINFGGPLFKNVL